MLRRLSLLTLAIAAVAGCDREPLGEPSPHITQVLQSAGEQGAVLQLPGGDTLNISPEVVAFYRNRQFRQAWTDYDEILEPGWALLRTMEQSPQDGLDPARYRYNVALSMVQQVEGDSIAEEQEPEYMATVDMVLSEVFGRYSQALYGGLIDPEIEGLDWKIGTTPVNVTNVLASLDSAQTPDQVLNSMRPAAPEYRRLMEAVVKYNDIASKGGWPAVPEDTPDEQNAQHAGVSALRQRLIAEGDPQETQLAQAGNAAPDRFDDQLREALEHFQRRHGLAPDGQLGQKTIGELNVPAEARVQQIRLNMDRWRWLPRELGERYILVNVAGYEMELIENDSLLLGMNVVVGQEGWETPIFQDTMEHIVVNPYWNVPPSILSDEVRPAAQRDPGYIARNNMEVLSGGRVVDPGSVNWNSSGISVRQKPGGRNALGDVKFLFPNEHNVYLHDTPADQYFAETQRAFSHGCIRLEKPHELARVLFERVTDKTAADFDRLSAMDTEQWVNLTEPLPVYILYFTAWADREGSVSFYPDVYERDERVREEANRQFASAE